MFYWAALAGANPRHRQGLLGRNHEPAPKSLQHAGVVLRSGIASHIGCSTLAICAGVVMLIGCRPMTGKAHCSKVPCLGLRQPGGSSWCAWRAAIPTVGIAGLVAAFLHFQGVWLFGQLLTHQTRLVTCICNRDFWVGTQASIAAFADDGTDIS